METTFETTMKCGSCLSKVTPLLDAEPSVASWRADLDDPRKPITVTGAGDVRNDAVLEQLSRVDIDAKPMSETASPHGSDRPTFRWSTYRPLALVVGYVVAATLLARWRSSDWDAAAAIRDFMGFFFIAFAFFKWLDVPKFADAFQTYDVIAKHSRGYALSYPMIETALGVMFLTGLYPRIAAAVTIIVMVVGLIGVVWAVRQKRAIQCACLGTAFNLPMSTVTIVENGVMAVMAAGMLFGI